MYRRAIGHPNGARLDRRPIERQMVKQEVEIQGDSAIEPKLNRVGHANPRTRRQCDFLVDFPGLSRSKQFT